MTTIKINRQSFLDALAAVEPAVPKKTPREILHNIKLSVRPEGVTLIGTDQEIAVRYSIPAECDSSGEFLIPAGRLRSILNEITGSSVDLIHEETTLTIAAAFSEFKLPTADVAEFPDFPELKSLASVYLKGSAFSQGIRRTIFATDPESLRYALGGILIVPFADRVDFVATDSRRLAIDTVACSMDGQFADIQNKIIIPGKAAAIVERLTTGKADSDLTIEVNHNSAQFTIGDQKVYTRMVEGRFPRYEDVVPKKGAMKIRENIMSGPFLSVVRQSLITTNEESRGVDFVFKPGKLLLRSEAASIGSSKIEMILEGSASDMTITLDPRFVADFLKVLSPEKIVSVYLQDTESAVLITTDDDAYKYVVMPLQRDR